MIIAIDGPSGTGKSTVAKGVAKKLGLTFFDTGAMYRSMAWWMIQNGVALSDEEAVRKQIRTFHYEIQNDPVRGRIYKVGDTDVTAAIRTPEISAAASKISVYGDVRKALVRIQREFGHSHDAVFEGRDMGTVVFPDADVKIFLTADVRVRAERRYQELIAKFPDLEQSLTKEQIFTDIEKRDHSDTTRAISPLKKACDATLIDTSYLSAEQVIERVVALVRCRKKRCGMRWTYGLILRAARFLLRCLYGLEVYGIDHFRDGAAIIASNHASHLDPPVVSVSCPQEVHFLAKESLFRIPGLGALIRHLNSHPVARNASDAGTFRLLIELLQKGHKVIVFPEGSRTLDGELQPIERGLPFLMLKARCRIQPVYVDGTFTIWRSGQKFPKLRGKIRCVFGSPIEWEEFEGLDKREAERRILERMAGAFKALKAWVEGGARGTPP